MTTITVNIDSKISNYLRTQYNNISDYVQNLIKEDIELKKIQESKESGIFKLNSLDELDED